MEALDVLIHSWVLDEFLFATKSRRHKGTRIFFVINIFCDPSCPAAFVAYALHTKAQSPQRCFKYEIRNAAHAGKAQRAQRI
jgi:hypothetical protein